MIHSSIHLYIHLFNKFYGTIITCLALCKMLYKDDIIKSLSFRVR